MSALRRDLLPIRETHRVARARLRAIARHVVDLVIRQAGRVHRRDHRIPVLDLRRPDFEVAFRQFCQRLFIAVRHRRNHLAIEVLVDHEVRQSARGHQRDALDAAEALDRAIQPATELETAMQFRRVVREVDVQDDWHARRRFVLKNRVIEEPVGVRNPAARRTARRLIRLRQVEVLVGERPQNVIGQIGGAGIGRTLLRGVGRLGDVQPGRVFIQMLDVADRLAAIDGNRRRQARIEELALIVADDDNGVRGDLVELVSKGFERRTALHEALSTLLHRDLVGESRRTRLQQPRVVVSLAAEPMVLVLFVRLGAEIPLLGGRGQQRSM